MAEKKNKSEENKVARLHLRITKSNLAVIKEKAAKLNMTVSDFVLFCTLNCDLNDKLDKIEKGIDSILNNSTKN